MLRLTTQQIAEMAGGELHGPPDVAIEGVGSLEAAGEDELTFIKDASLLEKAAQSNAGAIVAPCGIDGFEGTQIVCEDPELAFSQILNRFYEDRFPRPEGVSENAVISPSATLGEGASVGAGAVVDERARVGERAIIYPLAYVGRGAKIGKDTVIYPHVTVFERVEIGSECVIHSNTSIGHRGFGYLQREGRHVPVPHVGEVKIGDRVEIGALVTVDRAMLDETVIGDGAKIDSHSHLAHNTVVGENSILVAYAKLAGSVRLGKNVTLAEDVGITDHVTVGEGAVLLGRSGVRKDVEPGAVMWGFMARAAAKQRRIFAIEGRLPEMHERLKQLVQEVAQLKEELKKHA